MRALALMPVLWAVAWLLVDGTGAWLDATAAFVAFAVAAGAARRGRVLPRACPPGARRRHRPAHLRGRYFAVHSLSWGLAGAVGPAVGGFVLAAAPLRSGRRGGGLPRLLPRRARARAFHPAAPAAHPTRRSRDPRAGRARTGLSPREQDRPRPRPARRPPRAGHRPTRRRARCLLRSAASWSAASPGRRSSERARAGSRAGDRRTPGCARRAARARRGTCRSRRPSSRRRRPRRAARRDAERRAGAQRRRAAGDDRGAAEPEQHREVDVSAAVRPAERDASRTRPTIATPTPARSARSGGRGREAPGRRFRPPTPPVRARAARARARPRRAPSPRGPRRIRRASGGA